MATRFQLVFEDVVGSNCDIPVLKFRDTESGVETPSFILDAKASCSYSKWQIHFTERVELSDEIGTLFQEVVKAPKYDLVLPYKDFGIDGEMLSKLIDHLIWLVKITCRESNILAPEDAENENGSMTYFAIKKTVKVVIDGAAKSKSN